MLRSIKLFMFTTRRTKMMHLLLIRLHLKLERFFARQARRHERAYLRRAFPERYGEMEELTRAINNMMQNMEEPKIFVDESHRQEMGIRH